MPSDHPERNIGVIIYPLHTGTNEVTMAKNIFSVISSFGISAPDICRIIVNSEIGYARIHVKMAEFEDFLVQQLLNMKVDRTLHDLSQIIKNPEDLKVFRIKNIIYQENNEINFQAMSSEDMSEPRTESATDGQLMDMFLPTATTTTVPLASPEECSEIKFYYKNQKIEGKSQHVSFKPGPMVFSQVGFRNRVGKDMCEFLNSQGGTIYFGVNNEGLVCGVCLQREIEQDLIHDIKYSVKLIEPEVKEDDYSVNFVRVVNQDGTPTRNLKVLEVCVKPGHPSEIPYTYHSTVYRRRNERPQPPSETPNQRTSSPGQSRSFTY